MQAQRLAVQGYGEAVALLALELLDEAMESVPLHKHDPEARFRFAEMLAIFDRPERALEFLSLALDEGYRCHYSLLNHHCWDLFRSDGRFQSILKRAADMSRYARTVFLDHGGDGLLGVHVDARLPEIVSLANSRFMPQSVFGIAHDNVSATDTI